MEKYLLVGILTKIALVLGFLDSLFLYVNSEIYTFDGSKNLMRNAEHGLAYANFEIHKSHKLNITPLLSLVVKDFSQCGKACVDHSRCFSVNFVELSQTEGGSLCQLLPSDKYLNLNKFVSTKFSHHLSIQTPCSSDPCMNGSRCVAKYEEDDYYCTCPAGFHDKHGELQIKRIANCHDIKTQIGTAIDGMYWLDPDGGNSSNAFLAYCDMTSYNGGWTMCYTTDEYAKPKSEVTYNPDFPYGVDGYRTNCNNISFTEITFVDHQNGSKVYFKRKSNHTVKAAANYGKNGSAFGLWDAVGASSSYFYELLICDDPFYSGFMVSGFTGNCSKQCHHWCGDFSSPYFRTASNSSLYKGVAFNTNGAREVSKRLMSVGLR
ncbi:uncharacterized protein [Acropora muricata]|uniref:uncharacterized protein n=1 Tax=Acropora muricata TaxID=159855 RepID=UPI0034E3B3BC